jgi:hypothetical protein
MVLLIQCCGYVNASFGSGSTDQLSSIKDPDRQLISDPAPTWTFLAIEKNMLSIGTVPYQ